MKSPITRIICGALAAIAIVCALPCLHYYPLTAQVIQVSGDYVFLKDFAGHQWALKGREDWMVGDMASLIMYDRLTPWTIYDDAIVSARYAGWVPDGSYSHQYQLSHRR